MLRSYDVAINDAKYSAEHVLQQSLQLQRCGMQLLI